MSARVCQALILELDKAAFLHAWIHAAQPSALRAKSQKAICRRDISELVRQGQDLMVQVVKDPLGTKGARLTTDVALPSPLSGLYARRVARGRCAAYWRAKLSVNV